MEKTNNVIEKEFSTIGLIEQSLDGPYEKYLINFNLNTSIKSIQIGVVDANIMVP